MFNQIGGITDMNFVNFKRTAQGQQGFTIVELLIVVVVIAILAAITIVSYNGITNRANDASARATAASVQKKAELYAADGPTGKYPAAQADLTGAATTTTYYISTDPLTTDFQTANNPTSATGKNKVQYIPCGIASITTAPTTQTSGTTSKIASVTGGLIRFWDYNTNAITTTPITVGQTSGLVGSNNVNCPQTT